MSKDKKWHVPGMAGGVTRGDVSIYVIKQAQRKKKRQVQARVREAKEFEELTYNKDPRK